MSKASIEIQEEYIAQVYALDKERQALIAEMKELDVLSPRFQEIDKRLNSLYTAQASNAVILADFLKANIG